MRNINKGINLAWKTENKDVVKYYCKWIDYCCDNKIKLIRVILTSLGFNSLNNETDKENLIKVIDYA